MSHAHAWTDDEIAALHRLYPEGGSRAVHEVTGRPMDSIKVIANRRGIVCNFPRGSRKKFDPVHVVGVLEDCGWSPSAAAQRIGCSTKTVRAARHCIDAAHKAAVRARNEAARAAREARIVNHLEGMPA